MKALVVGTGRCGTLSLTQWFNELFARNHITAQAAHEHFATECYVAFDEYSKTADTTILESAASTCCASHFEVIIGNGYANLLPFFANLNKEIILIHLQRRDRSAWINSSAKNAKYYPHTYKYFVPDELLTNSDDNIPRTTAFHVGETTREEWAAWRLEEKLGWHYDYTHRIINEHSPLFAKTLHVYMEDLHDINTLSALAKLVAPHATNIPAMPKLNSHYFADIEKYSPEYRPYAQWLLGNIDWEKTVTDTAYLATYATNRLETWIGWHQSGMAQKICPKNVLAPQEIRSLLQETLPKLKYSIRQLEQVYAPKKSKFIRIIKKILAR